MCMIVYIGTAMLCLAFSLAAVSVLEVPQIAHMRDLSSGVQAISASKLDKALNHASLLCLY